MSVSSPEQVDANPGNTKGSKVLSIALGGLLGASLIGNFALYRMMTSQASAAGFYAERYHKWLDRDTSFINDRLAEYSSAMKNVLTHERRTAKEKCLDAVDNANYNAGVLAYWIDDTSYVRSYAFTKKTDGFMPETYLKADESELNGMAERKQGKAKRYLEFIKKLKAWKPGENMPEDPK